MKNKKGFTLIELLAVIVILIIILLVAVTAIRKFTKKAKEDSVKANGTSFIKAVDIRAIESKTDTKEYKNGLFNVSEIDIKINGTKPDNGYVHINDYQTKCSCLDYGKYKYKVVRNGNNEDVSVTKGNCNTAEVECSNTLSYKTFSYTGEIQSYTVPVAGTYLIKIWGASGGDAKYSDVEYHGGYGAYAEGELELEAGEKLYFGVGGQGQDVEGIDRTYTATEFKGFNGAAYGAFQHFDSSHGGGGGATHVAFKTGDLHSLEGTNGVIIIAAGAGGGASARYNGPLYSGDGGNGGGIVGGAGQPASNTCYNYGLGGTQTAAGKFAPCEVDGQLTWRQNVSDVAGFGKGSAYYTYFYVGSPLAAGGSGYYGGNNGFHAPGGGGSGYIGYDDLDEKSMYCYNCATSDEEDTFTVSNTCVSEDPKPKCSKIGDGYATILKIRNKSNS